MGRKNTRNCSKKPFRLKLIFGFSLTEIIIVLAIFSLLILLVIWGLNPNLQLARSRDKRRIADLKKISISLEDYAGDHDCYPEKIYASNTECRVDTGFRYYFNNIPCDPQTKKPYFYVRIDNCKQYVIYATLELEKENDYGNGNYYLASENVREIPSSTITSTPAAGSTSAPLPTSPSEPKTGYYGCKNYKCVSISDPRECSKFNFQYLDSCVGEECCSVPDVEFPCELKEYQCNN